MVGERVVLFRLGAVVCALPASSVQEILPLPRLRRPPAAPPPLLGFFSLGGRPAPALDLAALLGLRPACAAAHCDVYAHLVVVVDGDGAPMAYLVDRALDVIEPGADEIRAVGRTETLNGCVMGELSRAGDLVHVLDAGRLLLAHERERLENFAALEAERQSEWT